MRAIAASSAGGESPSPVEKFLGTHPSALAFVQAPKPAPTSFAKEKYFGVTAFKLIAADGKETFIRYQIVPDLGVETLSQVEVESRGPNYLQDEIAARVSAGGEGAFTFRLLAQIAEEGDVTNDATIHWPESRKVVELGMIKVEEVVKDNEKEQKYIIFDPIPRVPGIEPSDDPLLEMRAAVYLISGKQRRAAP